jgi:RNA polymerase sigma-70 factor (ECF subfamily)
MAVDACAAGDAQGDAPGATPLAASAVTLVSDVDEELMQAYAAGEVAAFDRLYRRHKGGVYRYMLRHCGNAGTADELFQDVWTQMIRARHTYVPAARFTTWLYRIAQNRLIDHWRVSGRLHLVGDDRHTDSDEDADDPIDATPAPRSAEPEVRVGSAELGRRIAAALADLPPAQRDAFLLQQEAGLALNEIAQVTGVGIETVKSRLRYAVASLRRQLSRVYLDAA